ncbi:MAG: hypothetical protein ABIO49_15095 [Dokdonella sp.]
MNLNPGLFGVVFCVFVGAVLLTPMLLARRRADQERGHAPAFEAFCVGSFGFGGTNFPMFRLSIYDSFRVIALLSPTVIPFAQVARVEVCGSVLARRVRIETKRGATYQFAVRNPEQVVGLLQHA